MGPHGESSGVAEKFKILVKRRVMVDLCVKGFNCVAESYNVDFVMCGFNSLVMNTLVMYVKNQSCNSFHRS